MKAAKIFLLAGFFFFGLMVFAFLRLSLPPWPWKGGEVVIPKGTSFREAVEILAREKVIQDPLLLYLYGKLRGLDRSLKPGRYILDRPLSSFEVLALLVRGSPETIRVVIPEGSTLLEVARILQEREVVSTEEFLQAAADPELRRELGIEAPSLEGYLFPDTYFFPPGEEPEEVIRKMVKNFRAHWPKEFTERAREVGLDDYEVLILASIIEKETALSEEKPLISAVFHNRLRKGMPLCADPTVIYGLGPSFKGDLTRADLRSPNPYNTYLQPGLPPTPICNPGQESIRAALYPARVPYLYFVSKGDGTHYFSRTLREHLEAVAFYQLKREQ